MQTTIETLLEDFSHIRLATEEDNQAILDFYSNETMKTKAEMISFDRAPDFFSFYKLTAKKYWLFLFLNKDMSIGGLGGVLRHVRNVNGKPTPLAYFCDLRISPNASRIAKLQWRKFFPVLINGLPNLPEDQRCASAYTAILADNDAAINSLTKGGRGITYRFLGKYFVHSYINTGLINSKAFYCQEITSSDYLEFYNSYGSKKFLAEEPKETFKNIERHSEKTSFLGVYYMGKLRAVLKPVLKNQARQLKVQNLQGLKKLSTKALKIFGRTPPNEDGKLNVLDLSHLVYHSDVDKYDKELIIEAIQSWIKREKLLKEVHIINIIDNETSIESDIIKRGLSFKTTGHLFEIHPESESGILPSSNYQFEGAFL